MYSQASDEKTECPCLFFSSRSCRRTEKKSVFPLLSPNLNHYSTVQYCPPGTPVSFYRWCLFTGKKTPGGAGTHTFYR